MENTAERFREALLAVDSVAAKRIAEEAVDPDHPFEFVEEIMVPVLEDIGTGWEHGIYSLAHVYMSSRTCEEISDSLLPPSPEDGAATSNTAIAVLNDYHLLGKKIVRSALRAAGFDILDLGRCSSDVLLEQVRENGIETLLISVLMLPSALEVADFLTLVEREKISLTVVVGGAPFRLDRELWRRVGADAVGYSAFDALRILRDLKEEAKS
ncbi:MAG: cobalamin-dependent protein [Bacillota bacterium]